MSVEENDPFVADDNEEMGDLFGGQDEVDESGHAAFSDRGDDGFTTAERDAARRRLEYGEDDQPEPTMDPSLVARDVTFLNRAGPRSSDGNYWVLRLPSYAKVEPMPFDFESFQPAEDDGDATVSAADRSLTVKMELANTLRWRWIQSKDGAPVRQSNGRMIRWNDGSMSFQIGSELYDISANVDESVSAPKIPRPNGPVDAYPSGTVQPQGLTYIAAHHSDQRLLQVEKALSGTLALKPAGIQTETQRKLAKAVAQKHMRVSRLRFTSDAAVAAAEKEQEQNRKKGMGGGRSRTGESSGRRRKSYGGAGTKRGEGGTRRRVRGYSDSDEDSEDSGEEADRRAPSTRGNPNLQKPGIGEYLEDEFLVADTDDEGDGEGAGPAKKKRKTRAELEEAQAAPDALDELDAQIERNERSKQDLDAPGDIEEDDEEEANTAVRKSAGRRKTAAFIDDSDEE